MCNVTQEQLEKVPGPYMLPYLRPNPVGCRIGPPPEVPPRSVRACMSRALVSTTLARRTLPRLLLRILPRRVCSLLPACQS